MKHISILAAILLLAPLVALGQTVTTGSLGTTAFCEGASFTIDYTASGTFGAKNVFTVQLSAPDGTFLPTFTNIGSVKSTVSGSIQATLPSTPGQHYRLRVTASNPYTVGNDNGSDITIGMIPNVQATIIGVGYYDFLIGDTISFIPEALGMGGSVMPGCSYNWSFDSGANPATSSDSSVRVSYSTTGTKTVRVSATSPLGCTGSNSDSLVTINIFGCELAISGNAYIDSVSAEESAFLGSNPIWVVPGGSLNLSSFGAGAGFSNARPIFAEAGTTISEGSGHVIYLKPGAVYTGGDNLVIYSPGAGVPAGSGLKCNSLSFDYSNAPPYKISWAGVTPNEQPSKIRIYPDPATHFVTIESPEIPHSIVVRNDLGDILLMDNGPIATNHLQFDVSQFAPGVYYVELMVSNHSSISKFTISR